MSRTPSLLLACLAMLLSSCSVQPPGCADSAVTSKLTKLSIAKGIEQWKQFYIFHERSQADLETYLSSVHFEIGAVTTSGYDASAKRHSCKAVVKMWAENRPPGTFSVSYTVQSLAGASGKWLIEDDGNPMIAAAVSETLGNFPRRN